MEEVTRELYHSLKFSNEDSSHPAQGEELSSFTFDVGHQKLEFSQGDEALFENIIAMIKTRMSENS